MTRAPVTVELTPRAVEQVAVRVAQLLRREAARNETGVAPGWMTAKELAGYLKVNAAWVYEHAEELGAIRTGGGPKARMRFDPQRATRALERTARSRRSSGR